MVGLAETTTRGRDADGLSPIATFEWDAKNQLVAVTVGTHRSEFTYDVQSRRVRMVEKENGLVQTDRQYVWVASAVAEELDAGSGAVTRRIFGVGEQVDGVALFYAEDHLGSVRELTDGSATVRARYAYDPWGRQTKLTGDLEAWGGFTGHPQHAASGLALTLYRGYDAGLGRWVSQDPIGLRGGINRFVYVVDRPTLSEGFVTKPACERAMAAFLSALNGTWNQMMTATRRHDAK